MNTEHEFDDIEYVRQWTATADERRPQRPAMFRYVAALIRDLGLESPRVLELGCGPGALADVLLAELADITYEGVDYSGAMLELARERLARFGGRPRLTRADLNDPEWLRAIRTPVDAVVTNQALHDLGSDEAVATTYRRVHALLPARGLFVNAELVIPADGSKPAKPGKMTTAAHLEALRQAGFHAVRCAVDHGEYVCLVAMR